MLIRTEELPKEQICKIPAKSNHSKVSCKLSKLSNGVIYWRYGVWQHPWIISHWKWRKTNPGIHPRTMIANFCLSNTSEIPSMSKFRLSSQPLIGDPKTKLQNWKMGKRPSEFTQSAMCSKLKRIQTISRSPACPHFCKFRTKTSNPTPKIQ